MRHFSSANRYFDVMRLRRLACLSGLLMLIVLACIPAVAQGEWQLYGGTSFLWARTTPQQNNGLSTINEWGWQTDISEYPWHWFGGTLESSGFYGRPGIYDPSNGQTYSNLLNTKSYTLMFGPTFAYTHNKTIQPFGHVLLGGVNSQYAWTSKGALMLGTTPQNHGEWIFGWALGGGADIRVSNLVAIRAQADWLPTTFYNFYNDRQNNIRLTVGLVFRFGGGSTKTGQMQSPQSSPDASSSLRTPNGATPQPAIAQKATPAAAAAGAMKLQTPPVTVANNSGAIPPVEHDSAVASAGSNTLAAQVGSEIAKSAVADQPQTQPTNASQHATETASTLQPGGAVNQPPATPEPSAAPVVQPSAMVEFWSSPSGADVLIDGHYVGSTYSTIAVTPGEHIIVVRKENYAPWQRTILITSGDVRVAAYLEQVKATITFH